MNFQKHLCIKLRFACMWSEVAQSGPTLCNPIDCSLPGSSVHGIFQGIVLEWVAISCSRGSFQPRARTRVSHIVDRRFTIWATREVPWGYLYTYCCLVSKWCPVLLQPHGLLPVRFLCSWDFPGKNTGVGCLFPSPGALPGIEPTSPALQADSLLLSHQGNPYTSMNITLTSIHLITH